MRWWMGMIVEHDADSPPYAAVSVLVWFAVLRKCLNGVQGQNVPRWVERVARPNNRHHWRGGGGGRSSTHKQPKPSVWHITPLILERQRDSYKPYTCTAECKPGFFLGGGLLQFGVFLCQNVHVWCSVCPMWEVKESWWKFTMCDVVSGSWSLFFSILITAADKGL